MANLVQSVRSSAVATRQEQHSFAGNTYWGYPVQAFRPNEEGISSDFASLINAGYRGNGVVFACELTRMSLFSEARMQFRRMTNGRPGDLFGTAELSILEKPWPSGTTGDLLTRMILDADFGGSAFVARRFEEPDRLRRMRPDWTTIVLGSQELPTESALALDADVVGYIYHPGGANSGRPAMPLLADEVAHFAPIPDPLATYRGMSWLTPIIREMEGDAAATEHKLAFFRQGASPQMVVSMDANISETAFTKFVQKMDAAHSGASNAYKTLYLGGGADVTVVGKDLAQLEFKATQGAGETRIAAAAGVHPVVAGLSEGLAGSSLNAGNFQAAARLVADRTLRPLWRNVAGSLADIVAVPTGADLWYDARDIAFLQEDRKDAAEIQFRKAQTIRQLVEAGFTPQSSIASVAAEDETLLVHTGLTSVQLQPPVMTPGALLNGAPKTALVGG